MTSKATPTMPSWLTGELVFGLLCGAVVSGGVGIWLITSGVAVIGLILLLAGFAAFLAGCGASAVRSVIKSAQHVAPVKVHITDLAPEPDLSQRPPHD